MNEENFWYPNKFKIRFSVITLVIVGIILFITYFIEIRSPSSILGGGFSRSLSAYIIFFLGIIPGLLITIALGSLLSVFQIVDFSTRSQIITFAQYVFIPLFWIFIIYLTSCIIFKIRNKK
jgi:hypothetical protein